MFLFRARFLASSEMTERTAVLEVNRESDRGLAARSMRPEIASFLSAPRKGQYYLPRHCERWKAISSHILAATLNRSRRQRVKRAPETATSQNS